jgi:hypothetical protein
VTAEEKRRRKEHEYYRARYPIRLWPFLWGGLVFAAILIAIIITTALRKATGQ